MSVQVSLHKRFLILVISHCCRLYLQVTKGFLGSMFLKFVFSMFDKLKRLIGASAVIVCCGCSEGDVQIGDELGIVDRVKLLAGDNDYMFVARSGSIIDDYYLRDQWDLEVFRVSEKVYEGADVLFSSSEEEVLVILDVESGDVDVLSGAGKASNGVYIYADKYYFYVSCFDRNVGKRYKRPVKK